LVGPRPIEPFTALVRALAHFYDVRAVDPSIPWRAGRLASSPLAAGAHSAARDEVVPLAVCLEKASDIEMAVEIGAPIVVAPNSVAIELAPDHEVVTIPDSGIDGRRWPAASPFVRERRRTRFRLPSTLIIEVGTETAPLLDHDLELSALALATAAIAIGPACLHALALGTPVVTDAASAAWLGATPDHDVIVSDPASAHLYAEHLAVDIQRAAALSSAAVRLVRRQHDTFAGALRVMARIRAASRSVWPVVEVMQTLGELATPPGALTSHRVADALSELGPTTKQVVTSHSW
jgi:hypothetical protein